MSMAESEGVTDERLAESIEVAVASLRSAVNYAQAYGGPVLDGSQYSPSDRAVHGAEWVYQNASPCQWERFVWALEAAYDELEIVWCDGIAWRADDLPGDDAH